MMAKRVKKLINQNCDFIKNNINTGDKGLRGDDCGFCPHGLPGAKVIFLNFKPGSISKVEF